MRWEWEVARHAAEGHVAAKSSAARATAPGAGSRAETAAGRAFVRITRYSYACVCGYHALAFSSQVSASYVEIYQNKVFDLLAPAVKNVGGISSQELQLKENNGDYDVGATVERIHSSAGHRHMCCKSRMGLLFATRELPILHAGANETPRVECGRAS